MELDTLSFFYDTSFEDYTDYVLKFNCVINGYLIKKEYTTLGDLPLFVSSNVIDDRLDLTKTLGIIENAGIDDIGIFGKLKFINTLEGKIAKFVNEINKIKLTPHGYGIPRTINNEKIFTEFILLGFFAHV